jgi:hypothetical protein
MVLFALYFQSLFEYILSYRNLLWNSMLCYRGSNFLYPMFTASLFPHFYLDIYIVQGDSLWQFWIGLHCTLARLPLIISPFSPLLVPVKALTRGFIILFCVCIWSPSPIFSHLHLLHSLSYKLSTSTISILQSCLLLLIPKSMFKGVSWCIPAVNRLNFGPFNPFHYPPLLLLFHPPLFNSFQYTSYIIYPQCRCNVFWYHWLSFSFPFPPPLSSIG